MIYNKEVQTTAGESEKNLQDIEEEIRQRILRENEAEAERVARDKELEEESVKLDQELEQEIRGPSPLPCCNTAILTWFYRAFRGRTC